MTGLRTYIFGVTLALVLFLTTTVSATGTPQLTPRERQWLADHTGRIRLAHTPDWPPLDFLDRDGTPTGMVADYIRLLEKKLNFKFKQVRVGSWEELLELARTRQIDVISAGQATEERRTYMNWSTPFLNLKTTIIVRKQLKGKLTLDRMQGMKIGVIHQYAVGEFIRAAYPHLTLIPVDNSLDGIRKVSFGELDAMITEVPNALYLIDTEKIPNLRLAGDTGFELHHGMGIRRDWPLFSQIIEKGIAAVTPAEHQEIYRRWVKLETQRFYMTRTFWYWVLGGTALVLVVMGTFVLWNMELKKQVLQRTRDLKQNEIGLEALLTLHEHPHHSIREIIEFAFRQMMDLTQSRFGYLTMEDRDGLVYVVDSDDSRQGYRLTTRQGEGRPANGLWGEALKSGKPVISNEYWKIPSRMEGLPPGKGEIKRYMNVPIFDNDRMVVVAGMGNKPEDYTPSDLRQLSLLAHGMWRLIQRRKAEQAMQRSEKRFQDLVENSPNGIAIVQGRQVVYTNPSHHALIGDLDFMSPQTDPRFHQEDLDGVTDFFHQVGECRLDKTQVSFRFYARENDEDPDSMTWISCLATPLEYNDRNVVLLIFINMTEARKLQHLLTIQDKMASLGHVSAGIAHEIRNPLSGINIYLGTIEKYFKNPEKTEKIESSIRAIRSASQKIESVIKRVMNFAKPTEPKFERIPINEPVHEAVNLTRVTLNKKQIDIRETLAPDLPPCYAEPHLIEEVILNLITNAADAVEQTGHQGSIEVSTEQAHGEVLIRVSDTGPGIPRDLKGKIFDPFFTTKPHSTGIGLSLCHRIITDHRGKISAETASLGGACFLIRLPVTGPDAPPADNRPPLTHPGNGSDQERP